MKKTLLPEYSQGLFQRKRYKVLYGGRGSSKSQTIARCLLILGKNSRRRILCAREFQNSIAESVHNLLGELIDELGLRSFYKVTDKKITGINGTEFIFKGIRHNVDSIKSMQGLTDVWLEEAHTISKRSWDVLIPTVRAENSEIWVSFNPDNEDDPTFEMFVNVDLTPKKRDDAVILKVNWRDNPWFPETLKKEKDYLFEVDSNLAMHVWEGYCRSNGDAQIFKDKWEQRSFEVEPSWSGPYIGTDWGFSVDPHATIETYIDTDTQTLYIRHEAYKVGVELEDLAPFIMQKVPLFKEVNSRADNARPETISFIRRKGYPIEACTKWAGSVQDGVEFLRTFRRIVIHTDCPRMADEAKWYSYEVDRLTGEVTTRIKDKHNHGWDAIRYALGDMISANGLGLLANL